MGKRLTINGANFAENGIAVGRQISADWDCGGFIYDNDSRVYKDTNFAMRAYQLISGKTYNILTTANGSYKVNYKLVNIATASANLPLPTPTAGASGSVSIGTITKVATTNANVVIWAQNRTFVASSACTLLITTGVNDSVKVIEQA